MAKARSPIPEGLQAVTPDLAIKGAGKAIDFYKKVFGAQEISRAPGPDGTFIMHAHLQIGNSPVFVGDVLPDMAQDAVAVAGAGGPKHSRVVLTLYVKDADAVFKRAVEAGAEVIMPLEDQFWGDRYGQIRDPFGHIWAVATHIEDLSPEETQKRGEEFFASMKR